MDEILKILHDVKKDVDFEKEDKLIDRGIISVFDAVEAAFEIEKKYNIEFDLDDCTNENFNSLKNIKALVDKTLKHSAD